jgi:excinuclease ABC subunit A
MPWSELPPETRRAFLFHKSEGKGAFEGPGTTLTRWLADPDLTDEMREVLEAYATPQICPTCQGTRLKPQALAVRLRGRNIAEISSMPLDVARAFFEAITWTPREWQIGQQMIQEIGDRLRFLNDIGLGYLTLDRPAGTLAGGELQRIRLATQIGSQLTGVLYVLDEPSIGLHMRDNERLIQSLTRLRDMGNTVIVVEHDEATMKAADYLIDLGPGAGRLGGEVVAEGPPAAVMQHPTSLTGQYLSGRRRIEVPSRRRAIDPARQLIVRGAAHHNLRDIDVAVPLGCLVCVTGVSGSGKSTLVSDILLPGVARRLGLVASEPGRHRTIEGIEHLDKIIEVEQSPIGRTPRSNCATYTGAFSLIRDLFAGLPEARMNGYKPGHFSFNVAGGRCEHCKGAGSIKLEMAFLPEVYVECEVCHGRRYGNEILTVRYRDKSIADVLEMSVGDSLEFFAAVPRLQAVLRTVHDVGLNYIQIGQPATTLSGGEAQRIKLSKELARRNTGRTLYLLDEPTTGLHFEDIRKLIEVLQRLVDAGSTVVVVEHNIDVIKCADYVIDLGPEGGTLGGALVVAGTPEDVARHPQSHTGRFLAEALRG